ncbi:phage integrase SAM-like domain-containing protein [Winogradskyella sp. SM1960]|uniref:phage integrase SAM-like domain-containing protein n=1 Tax=Winogradskyella sp. SM1960 TaxID=2865955 RepID=UPI001CD29272|nr:phage integrase SAM-like domain-containing protein [Winogradskyella sp. SM1960]
MASGKFRIKTDNEWNTIYYRFKQGGQFDIELSTGIQTPKGRWSQSKQKILDTPKINFKDFNLKLQELDTIVRKEYEDSKINSTSIDSMWLKKRISSFFKRETKNKETDSRVFLTNFIEVFIKESHNKKSRNNTPISKKTIQHYTTTLNKVIALEKYINKRVLLKDIDIEFHSKMIDFLETKQHLNPNTIGGYIDDIKLFCRNASRKGIEIPNDYRFPEFYSPTNKTKDIYLKEEEINKIYHTNFNLDYLENAKDWFIIGVRTGFRISDFLKLTKKNIDGGFIEKTTKKTDFPVITPLHDQVQAILDKRNGSFPRKISDQKFNDYIKIVCKEIGMTELVEGAKICPIQIIDENGEKKKIHRKKSGKFPKYQLVTSHVCRRSFATNLYGKIDTLTIMKITGHKTESQFLDYIKITPKEYAEKLKQYWKKTQL